MTGIAFTGINPELLYNRNPEKVWLSRTGLSARAGVCAAVGGMGVGIYGECGERDEANCTWPWKLASV